MLGVEAVRMQSSELVRLKPALEHIASVALRLDKIVIVGEAPDGMRMQFMVHGTVNGSKLKGEFPTSTAAYLRIDRDGVGTIHVRAPLLLHDGATAELDATGRYDFGEDGYARAVAGDLPDSDLGWCPRLLTGDARYLWLNRTQFLGVGKLRPKQGRVDYDLFSMSPSADSARRSSADAPTARALSTASR
jgi:hypothetical protein